MPNCVLLVGALDQAGPLIDSRTRLPLVECHRGRQVAIAVDLLFQVLHFLLGHGNGIGTSDETARRGLLADNPDERLRELGRVAGLLAMLGLIPFSLGGVALGVVRDGWLAVGR